MGNQIEKPLFDPDNCDNFIISADDLYKIKREYDGEVALKQYKLIDNQEIPDVKYDEYERHNIFIVDFLKELKKQMEICVQNKNCPIKFHVSKNYPISFFESIRYPVSNFPKLVDYFEKRGYKLATLYYHNSHCDNGEAVSRYFFTLTSIKHSDKYSMERREIIQEKMVNGMFELLLEKYSKIKEDQKWIMTIVGQNAKLFNKTFELGIISFDNSGYIGNHTDFCIDYNFAIKEACNKLVEKGYWVGTKKGHYDYDYHIILFKGEEERKYFKRMKNDEGYQIMKPKI